MVGRAEAGDESERVVLDMDSNREPRPWATGRELLQPPFRIGLLPPAVVVQPARRLSGGEAALRECPQRRGLGRTIAAGDRTTAGRRQAGRFSGAVRPLPSRRFIRLRRNARSINVCERTDEPWRLPTEVMYRIQREKDVVFGSARVYTVAEPEPKWKSSFSLDGTRLAAERRARPVLGSTDYEFWSVGEAVDRKSQKQGVSHGATQS